MDINGMWYQVRRDLETVLDQLFSVAPVDLVEYDSLLTVEELNELSYARNFPHLTCLLCGLAPADLHGFSSGTLQLSREYRPLGTSMALLPATCYKVYLENRNRSLTSPKIVGCIAKCFRHEDKPLDSYRGYNFTMKEFVCLGGSGDAKSHIEKGRAIVDEVMRGLDIHCVYEAASDPFFDGSSSVATLSKALPTKIEALYEGHAVASFNHHRNYFGRKFAITLDGAAIHTSCVAFGLERWIAMLQDRHRDPMDVRKRLGLIVDQWRGCNVEAKGPHVTLVSQGVKL